jgi:hypothetical protein
MASRRLRMEHGDALPDGTPGPRRRSSGEPGRYRQRAVRMGFPGKRRKPPIPTDQHLEFKGPDSAGTTWTLHGDKFGTAHCQALEAQIICNEKLDGIAIDMDAVQQCVQAGELAPERLQVTKAFQGDPIGILRFPAP